MDFVVGLSENLLSECRRLTAENHTIKSKMKTQLDEISNYKAQVMQLSKTRLLAASNESDLKDKNWDLETTVSNLTEDLESLRVANEKLVKSHNETMIRLSGLQRDNDEYQLKALTMAAEWAKTQDLLKKENADLHARIEELNDENDDLHMKVSEFKELGAGTATLSALAGPDSDFVDVSKAYADSIQEQDDGILNLDEILKDSDNILNRQHDPRSSDLEIETVKANLAHSNHTISRLRAALVKLSSSTAPSSKNTPKASKVLGRDLAQKLAKKPQVHTPAKKGSKFILLNDSEHDSNDGSPWPKDDNWEDFIGQDSHTPSKPSRNLAQSDSDSGSDPAPFQNPLQRTNSYLQDSDSSELDFEPPKKSFNQRVLALELSAANLTITEEHVQKFAADHNLVLVSLENYAKLEYNDISDMSIDRISTALDSKGYLVLSKSEHDELVDEQEMKKRLMAKGLVFIPGEELEGMKSIISKYDDPDFSYLSEKLSVSGYEPVDSEHLASLKKNESLLENPSESFLLSKCKAINRRPVPFEEYEHLKSVETDHEQPLKDYLRVKSEEVGLKILSAKEYEELEKMTSPLVDQVRKNAEAKGFVLMSKKEFESLTSPAFEDLSSQAEKQGYVVLERTAYEKFKSPSLERLKRDASKLDAVILSHQEHKALTEPSVESLGLHAEKLGHAVIPQQKIEELQNPSLETIQEKAVGYKLLKNEEYETILKHAHEPSLALVQKHAERHDLVTLASAEYTDLFRQANEPPHAHLVEKAHEKGFDLVKTKEYEMLKCLVEDPDREFLAEKAKQKGLEVVETEEYSKLRDMVDKPGIDFLKEKAKSFQSKVIALTEWNDLLNNTKVSKEEAAQWKKQADELEHKLRDMLEESEKIQGVHSEKETGLRAEIENLSGEVTALGTEISSLKENNKILEEKIAKLSSELENPSEEYLRNQSRSIDHLLVKQAEFETLKKLEDPDISYLSEKAHGLGFETILMDELKSLKKPSLEQIHEHALLHEQKVVPNADLQELTRKANEPTKGELAKDARLHKALLVDEEEYAKLEKMAKEPNMETINRVLEASGSTAIKSEQKSFLEGLAHNPDISHISEKAALLEMKVLPEEEYNGMVECIKAPTLAYLEEKARAQSHELVDATKFLELKRLAESPSSKEIEAHAKRLELCTLAMEEYLDLKARADNPSVGHLKEKAEARECLVIENKILDSTTFAVECTQKHGWVTLESKTYDDLVHASKNPSAEVIKSNSKTFGLVSVPEQEYAELVEKLENPSQEFLEAKAEGYGLVIVEKAALGELKRKAASPTLDEVKSYCKDLGQEAFPAGTCGNMKDEILSLKEIVSEKETLLQSEDYVKEHANKMGYTLVGLQALHKLQNPDIGQVSDMAQTLKHKTLPEKDYEELYRVSHNPSLQEVSCFAAQHNSLVVDKPELERLQQNADHPDLSHLQKHADIHKHVLVNESEYAETLKQATSPSLEHAKQSAKALGHVMVPEQEYEVLARLANEPAIEDVAKSAARHNHSVIPKDKHQKLLLLAYKPELAHIVETAKKHGLVVVPEADYERLSKPSLEHLAKEAEKHDHLVIPREEFQAISTRAHAPTILDIKVHAEKMSHEVIDTKDAQRLRELAERPSLEHLTAKAEGLDHSVLPLQELASMKKQIEDPGLSVIKDLAARHQAVVLPERELADLKKLVESPELDYLQTKARAHQCSVVPESELSNLRKIVDSPAESHVRKHAKALGLVTLSEASHNELKKLAHAPELEHIQTHNERLGLVSVASDEFSGMKRSMESPSLDYLKEKISSQGYVAVPSQDFERHLEDKEKIKNMKLITHGEYDQLKSVFNLPSLAFLEDKAKALERVVIEELKLQDMKAQLEKPAVEFLAHKADMLGKALIDQKELESMQESIRAPSEAFLAEKANEMSMTLLPISEHASLTKRLQSPSLQYLSEHSESQGYKVISGLELAKLQQIFQAPSLEFLQDHAKTRDLELVPASELVHLNLIKKSYSSPTLEYLQKCAASQNHQVVSEDLFEELHKAREMCESPTIEFLERHARSKQRRLVEFRRLEELSEVEASHKNPSISYLETMALNNNRTMVITQEFQELQSPSLETLKLRALDLGHVLLSESRHGDLEALERSYRVPSLEYLHEKASQHKHVIVPEVQFESTSKHLADVQEKLRLTGTRLEEKEQELSDNVETIEQCEKKLEEMDQGLMETETKLKERDQEFLESLKKLKERDQEILDSEKKLEEKTQQFLQSQQDLKAELLETSELLVASQQRLKEATQEARGFEEGLVKCQQSLAEKETEIQSNLRSLEFLRQKAGELSHEILPQQDAAELHKLRQFDPATVEEYARQAGQKVVTGEKYDQLESARQTLEQPGLAYLQEKSQALGHVAVPMEEHSRLLSKDRPLEDLAHDSGYIAMPKDQWQRENERMQAKVAALANQVEAPLEEYLRAQAAKKDCVLLSKSEHDSTVKQAKAKHTPASIYAGAEALGLVVMSSESHAQLTQPLEKRLEDDGLQYITKADYEAVLAEKENPAVFVLEQKAAVHGYTMVPADELASLRSASDQTLEQKAESENMALLGKSLLLKLRLDSSRLHDMEKALETPSRQYLDTLSARSNCVVISTDQYDDLQREKSKSIFEKAEAFSLVAIPKAEYEQMKQTCTESLESRADREDKAVLKRDELTRLLDPPVSDLNKFAEAHGYVLVNGAQFEAMKREMSQGLAEKAQNANMTLLPIAEHENLASFRPKYEALLESLKSTQFLREKAKEADMELVTWAELQEMSETTQEKAKQQGLVLVPLSEFAALQGQVQDPSLESIFRAARVHQYSVVPNTELVELRENASKTLDDHMQNTGLKAVNKAEFDSLLLKANKPSIEQLSEHAARNGMVLSPEEDYAKLKAMAHEPLQARAEKAGASVVPALELAQLHEKVESPSVEYLGEKARQKGYLFAPDVDTLSKDLGVVVLSQAEYDDLSRRFDLLDLQDEKLEGIRACLQEQGYVVIHTSKYEFMSLNLSQCTDEQLETAAKSRGMLVFANLDQALEWCRSKDMETDDAFEDAGESFNIKSLQEHSGRLGMVVVEKSQYEAMKRQSEQQSKQQSEEPQHTDPQHTGPATEAMSKEEVMSRVRDFNLFILEKSEYQRLKDSADKVLTEDELYTRAQELGFKVTTALQYHAMKQASDTLQDPGMLSTAARQLKYICVPEKAFVPTTKVRVPEPDKVTVIPLSYYEKLSGLEALNVEKLPDHAFQEHALKRGYHKDAAAPFTPVGEPSSELCNFSPSSSLGENLEKLKATKAALDSPPANAKARRVQGDAMVSPEAGPKASEAGNRSHHSVRSDASAGMDSLTGLSIATNISLTDRSMIQAITQVVIGEYLFKYYRKLGPLSSISASRHERYFWVHPYSLTLYWSASNPVLTNPSEVKTKAMAIERVESVDDPNPLPTGLHHKSIMVHSRSKSIKITCPTRQRHNIWYNALRYLVNKNISDLDFKLKARAAADPDELSLTELDIEPSTRHAFPRSSTMSTSRSKSSLSRARRHEE